MARIRAHQHYSDTRAELAEYKDARRGAVEDALWDEDELVDHRSSPAKRKRPKKARGCLGNDFGPHVYVWEPWWPGSVYEVKRCCGCEARPRRAFRKRQ